MKKTVNKKNDHKKISHINHAKKKHVKVTHAHKRPYRKRHYMLLIVSLVLGISFLSSIATYANSEYLSRQTAVRTISELFGRRGSNDNAKFTSTYGFSFDYDQNQFYASAVNVTDGESYIGDELAVPRAYNALRLSDQKINSESTSTFKLNFDQSKNSGDKSLKAIEGNITEIKADRNDLKLENSKTVRFDNVPFLRSEWTRTAGQGEVKVGVRFVTYSAVLDGNSLTVVASGDASDAIMSSFSRKNRTQAFVPVSKSAASRYNTSLNMVDKFLNVGVASAAAPSYTSAERVSATYSPAVVKIYNIQIGNFTIDGQTVLSNQIAGGTGSGFLISSDGYVVTNGHVAVIDPREEIVKYALRALVAGNSGPMSYLVATSGITQSEIAGKTQQEALKTVIVKLYSLDKDRFKFTNSKQNLLVGLSDEQVDTKELLRATAARQTYVPESSIKAATLKSSDYEGAILPAITRTFSKSDVALLKIGGENYPSVQLGSMKSVPQGGNLNIMGFPGIGSSNGLVSETKTSATLTTGKVSSIKQDTGGRGLIETDTEIGHGNSGGPAFNDDGEVVGVATYSVTGSTGGGVLNYVRDIEDVKKLSDAANVDYAPGQTQKLWENAISQFYTARYKKAVANFAEVKKLYPDNPRVDELTAIANTRIANGENIDDFPIGVAVVVGFVVLTGIGASVFFIIRHKRGHNALVQGVMSGNVQPPQPGMPQMVPQAVPTSQIMQPNSYFAAPTQQNMTQPGSIQTPYQASGFVQTTSQNQFQPQSAEQNNTVQPSYYSAPNQNGYNASSYPTDGTQTAPSWPQPITPQTSANQSYAPVVNNDNSQQQR